MNRKHAARRKKHRRKMLLRLIPLVIVLLILVLGAIIFATSGALEDLSYSDKKADIGAYITDAAGGSVSDSEAIIVKNGRYTDGRVTILGGTPYIQYDTVKSDYISRFYKDEKLNQILYTNATETIRTEIGSSTYGVSGTEYSLNAPATTVRGETLYMSFDYLSLYMTLDYKICGGSDGTPFRIEIYTSPLSYETATLKEDKAIRVSSAKKADVLVKPGRNTKVRLLNDNEPVPGTDAAAESQNPVIEIGSGSSEGADAENTNTETSGPAFETESGWQKVMTEDMIIGYIESKYLSAPSTEQITVNEVEPLVIQSNTKDKKIVLGWSMIAGQSGNDTIYSQLDASPGMNVISPTWFYIADNDGNINSFASKDIVKTCHNRGIEVWGMVDNFTNNDITTGYILGDQNKRRHVISQLISLADEYNLDGINIDFESLPEDAGEPFIQFIRELSIECRAKNLVLSVDNYVPKAYTNLYNRKEQGIFADYVIVMGYDEHTTGSDEIGSVASIGFVKEGIEKTIEEVPANKVINALPFYTRMWRFGPMTTEETGGDGERNLVEGYYIEEVQTLPMQQAIDTVKSHSGAEVRWDEETMQNYAEWKNSGDMRTCIWLEDAQSLEAKLKVMTSYNIGGAAVWQIGYGEPFAWEVIQRYY